MQLSLNNFIVIDTVIRPDNVKLQSENLYLAAHH